MLDIIKSFRFFDANAIHSYFPDIIVHTITFKRWYEVKFTFTYDLCGLDDDLRLKNHRKWSVVAKAENAIFDSYI